MSRMPFRREPGRLRLEAAFREIRDSLREERELLGRLAASIDQERYSFRQGSHAIYRVLEQVRAELEAVRTMEAARAQSLELERNPRYQEPGRLQRHAFQVNSQNGEDGIIREIFRRIGTTGRLFVEVGVGDGTENNTAFLLAQGWRGFWIDGRDEFLVRLAARPDLQDGCLKTLVARVDRDNAAGLFRELGVPAEFDLLSLDIDQNSHYAWEGLHGFSPRVVVIEYNAAIPPDLDWQARYAAGRDWDYSQNFGAGLKALEKLGSRLGYCLVGCDFCGVNAFFVRHDLVKDRFAEPFTAENHYEPPRYPALLHRRGHPRAILDRLPSDPPGDLP
jgi:hypothetical protein